jgi:hypothetical protein
LPLPQGIKWDNSLAFAEIEKAIKEEFDQDVVCYIRDAALLLRSGCEELGQGILIIPENLGFDHVCLFLSMFQMGRKLNTCMYTLFSPNIINLQTLRESLIHALKFRLGLHKSVNNSLSVRLNPRSLKPLAIMLKENQQQKVSIFENTIRESVLRGIALYKETLGSSGEVTY